MLVSRKHKRSAGKAPQPPKDPNARQLEVTADRIVFSSPDTDYAVLAAHDSDDNSVRLTGPLTHVAVGESLTVKGRWTRHPQHGFNFKVSDAVTTRPKGLVGIASYLEHSLHGVGPATAQKIVDHFGQDTLEILDNNPERLAEVAGLGAKKAKAAMEHWADQQATRTVMLFLQQNSVPTWAATRIYRAYGEGSIGRIHENPYVITELERVGFKTADELALNMGLALNDPRRIDAGIVWVLRQAEEQGVATGKDKSGRERRLPGGNCYLPLADLIGAVRYTLSVDEAELVDERIRHQATAGRVVIESSSSGERHVYTPRMHDAEKRLASKIRSLLDSPVGFEMPDELKIPSETMNPTDQQLQAIEQALSCRLSVLTGNPGSGKTATLALLVETIEQHGHTIQLCAPTGKAAKRMTEATGHEAKTIHRLLEWQPFGTGFARNRRNPIDCDVLVVDEASMVDLPLMAKMLRALGEDARLVLVGDKDQLASVEAGSVLGDVCSWSPGFREAARARMAKLCDEPIPTLADTGYDGLIRDCVVVLTRNRRFGPESGIHRLAQAVRASSVDGVMEAFAKPEQVRAEDGGPGPDVAFVDVTSSRQLLQLLRETAPAGYRDYLGIARKGRSEGLFDSFNRFRFLCAVRQGDFGVEHVNAAIADVLDGANLISGPGEWYAGRPIMVTRNDYSLNLFNGVVGIAVGDQRTMRVHFEGDTSLPPARLPTHETVYAMTIHKSQGSEFGTVVVVLPPEDSRILGRELLYTAITRAKSRVVLWGSKKSLEAAIATTLARSSGLADALWTRTSPA